MLKIEQWCPEKPYLVRIIAQDMTRAAISLYESLCLARESTIPDHFTIPDVNEWFSYYETNHFVENMSNILNEKSIGATVLFNTLRMWKKEELIVPENLKGLSDEQIYREHIKEIEDDIIDRTLTKEEIKFAKENIIKTKFLFLWKITNPCQILYNSQPHDLFTSAKRGDVDALSKLLRLDKLLINHPTISNWIARYAIQKNKCDFEQLSNAIAKPITARHTLGTTKVYLAGYISYLCYEFRKGIRPKLRNNYNITAPEIRRLYDAIAIDYGINELCDEDLPASDETLSKAIQRQKEKFKNRFYNQQNSNTPLTSEQNQ